MADDLWIIQARTGFAVGGETLELQDQSNVLIDLTNMDIEMRVEGYSPPKIFSDTAGNFTLVTPVAPATHPTAWAFTLTTADVTALNDDASKFEVLIADGNDVLIGSLRGVIYKR